MTDQPEQPRWQWDEWDEMYIRDGVEQTRIDILSSLNNLEAEVTRLRQELADAKFSPMGDNHHNAAECPHCGAHAALEAEQELVKVKSRVDFIERQHDLVKGDWFRACEVNNGLRQELAEAKAALEYQKNKADIAVDQWEECRDGWDYAESALTAERALRTRLMEALEDVLEAGKGYAGGVCSQFCVHSMDPPDSCPIKNPVWADAADALAEARALAGKLVEQDGSDVSEAEG